MRALIAFVVAAVGFVASVITLYEWNNKSASWTQSGPQPMQPTAPPETAEQRRSREQREALVRAARENTERAAQEQRDREAREQAERQRQEAARQQAEAEQARRDERAQHWAPILQIIKSHRAVVGRLSQLLGGEGSFRLFFTSLDLDTGQIEGTLEFSRSCVTRFTGTVSSRSMLFNETEFIQRSNGCTIGTTWHITEMQGATWYGEIENREARGAMQAFNTRIRLEVE